MSRVYLSFSLSSTFLASNNTPHTTTSRCHHHYHHPCHHRHHRHHHHHEHMCTAQFAHSPVCSLQQGPNVKQSKLQKCKQVLQEWQSLTKTPPNQMPTDSQLRRCHIAQSLHLSSIINQAGGFRHVREQLNLVTIPSSQRARQQELKLLAQRLERLCTRLSHPPPHVVFPTREFIRTYDPALANHIAAYPSKAGFTALTQYFQPTSSEQQQQQQQKQQHDYISSVEAFYPVSSRNQNQYISKSPDYGKWVNVDYILEQLREHQPHPNVMPSLGSLPQQLRSAIQRKGGSRTFACSSRLVHHQNYQTFLRLADIARWLACRACPEDDLPFTLSNPDPELYLKFITEQSAHPPSFPKNSDVPDDILRNIAQIGGKKTLALRLGYSESDSFSGLYMGSFSVQLSSDILNFAIKHVTASHDGFVTMPATSTLQESPHLLRAVESFGGELAVGRRLGLAPQ